MTDEGQDWPDDVDDCQAEHPDADDLTPCRLIRGHPGLHANGQFQWWSR